MILADLKIKRPHVATNAEGGLIQIKGVSLMKTKAKHVFSIVQQTGKTREIPFHNVM